MKSRRRDRRRQQASIDMTPLMDLTFMLLIIFVITVPSMYYKSDVQLTPPSYTTNDKMETTNDSVYVELDRDGSIWLGLGEQRHSKSIPSPGDLTRELAAMKTTMPDMLVYLVGDKDRKYAEVMELASAVQHAGVDTVSLVFNPESSAGNRN